MDKVLGMTESSGTLMEAQKEGKGNPHPERI